MLVGKYGLGRVGVVWLVLPTGSVAAGSSSGTRYIPQEAQETHVMKALRDPGGGDKPDSVRLTLQKCEHAAKELFCCRQC